MIAWLKREVADARRADTAKNSIGFKSFSRLFIRSLKKFYDNGSLLEVVVYNQLRIITINIDDSRKISLYYNDIFGDIDVEMVIYRYNKMTYSVPYKITSVDDFSPLLANVISQINVITA